MQWFDQAMELYRLGRARDAEAVCETVLATASNHVDALMLLADIRLSTGRAADAILQLTTLSHLRPTDAANLRRLAGALLSLSRANEAVLVLKKASELQPDNIRTANNLGQALMQLGDIPAAIQQFQRALELDAHYAIGHHNLGLALTADGQLERAVAAFERAVTLDASLSIARVNLGAALEKLGRSPQALQVYDGILGQPAAHLAAMTSRGAVLLRKAAVLMSLDRADEALQCADDAMSEGVDAAEALIVKAEALCKLRRPSDALRSVDQALELNPAFVEGWCNRAVVSLQLGDHDSAQQSYRRALSLDADCVAARSGLLSALIPAVPGSGGEALQARAAFVRELGEFAAWLRGRQLDQHHAWMLAKQHLFYLSYREESNSSLLSGYRRLCAEALGRATGIDGPCVPESPRDGRRLRVGFVSAHVRDHSVYHAILRGWLGKLPRDKFETTLFSLGVKRDAVTDGASKLVNHFEADPRSGPGWAKVIRQRRLDALIFPEVGMDPLTLALAGLRLAERQFAAWGHPETTGLPTMDHYLSGDAFEPADAQEHYSERLIRLPHFGVYYEPQATQPVPVDFARYGIPAADPVFICPGTPFKYHPDDDWVLVEIARRLGPCSFVFFEHEKAALSQRLRARLAEAFRQAGLGVDRYLVFVPWLPRAAFLGLLGQADVYLDTLGFSGFNTLMQAVQAHLPSVAYEGRCMRGRLGSGILRRLGLPELVATGRAQYVDIAVALAEDEGHRTATRLRLRENEHRAYADVDAVAALERVLLG
jgi:predicted O-linked N-acetylglucosamine transferase (SPINDLY family)